MSNTFIIQRRLWRE